MGRPQGFPNLSWTSTGPEILCSDLAFIYSRPLFAQRAALGSLAPERSGGNICSVGGLIPSVEVEASLQPSWLPVGPVGTGGLLASLARSIPLTSSSSVWRHLLVSTESLWSHRHCEVRHSLVAISPPAGRWVHDRPDLHAIHL